MYLLPKAFKVEIGLLFNEYTNFLHSPEIKDSILHKIKHNKLMS